MANSFDFGLSLKPIRKKTSSFARYFFIPSLQRLESRETPSVTAVADLLTITQTNTPVILNVLANDQNPDGNGLRLVGVRSFTNGTIIPPSVTPSGPTLVQNNDGTFTFQSSTNGTFTFDYTTISRPTPLTPSSNELNQKFGSSASLSADGNTMAIGAPYKDSGSSINKGAIYIFTKNNSEWSQQALLFASNSNSNDELGNNLSISADGNTLAATSNNITNGGIGSIYIFSRSNGIWTQQTQLSSTIHKIRLSADGNTLVARSASISTIDPVNNPGMGVGLTVFARNGSTWSTQEPNLLISRSGYYYFNAFITGDDNNLSISADGNTILLGVQDMQINGVSRGAAYVFSRSGNSWSEQAELSLSSGFDSFDFFGGSVALSADGNTAIIGASGFNSNNILDTGAAFIFTRSGNFWSQSHSLSSPSPQTTNNPSLNFGSRVDLSADGNTALVVGGFRSNPDDSSYFRESFLFLKSNNNWIPYQHSFKQDFAGNNPPPLALSADGNYLILANPTPSDQSPITGFVALQNWTQSSASATLHVGPLPFPVISHISTDSGISNSDAITNDNSISLHGSATPGFSLDLFLANQKIGSTSADSSGLWSFDFSNSTLNNGLHSFFAKAFGPNNVASADSQQFHVTIDNTNPTASIVPIQTPRNNAVSSITITFSEPVAGLDISDFSLNLNNQPVSLNSATLGYSGNTYTIQGLGLLTNNSGNYTLTLNANNSGITDIAGNPIQNSSSISWFTDTTPPSIKNIVQANNDNLSITQTNTPVILNVLANDQNPDGNGLRLVGVRSFTNGTIIPPSVTPSGPTLVQNNDGTFTFQSSTNGTFTFDYTTISRPTPLTPSSNELNQKFGSSASLSADGNTMAIGAPYKDSGSSINKGAIYIFTKNNSEWSQQALLFASNSNSNDELGNNLSISADGNTLAATSNNITNGGIGSIYIFSRSNGIWTQQTQLSSTIHKIRLSADGNTLVARSASISTIDPVNNPGMGVGLTVFARNGSTWSTQEPNLLISRSGYYYFNAFITGDDNNLSISADGNTILLGVQDMQINGVSRGAAYVFSRSGNSWSEQAELSLSSGFDSFDFFGGSVALSADGNTAIIGASGFNSNNILDTGAAFIFTRSGNFWSQSHSLSSPSPQTTNNPSLNFGSRVDLSADGNTALVVGGFRSNPDDSSYFRESFLFLKSNNNWIPYQHSFKQDFAGNNPPPLALSADGNYLILANPTPSDQSPITGFVALQNWTQSSASATLHVGPLPFPVISHISTDSGISNSDAITNDNSISLHGSATPGFSLDLFLANQKIGSTSADSSGLWSFDFSNSTLNNGLHSFFAKELDSLGVSSGFSAPILVLIDNISPNGSFQTPAAQRTTPLDSIEINFSEEVFGFDPSDLSLTRNGAAIPTQGITIAGSGKNLILSNLTSLTGIDGNYELKVISSNSNITDKAGNALGNNPSIVWSLDSTPPTATFGQIASPTQNKVQSLTILFSENVTGLDITDIEAFKDGNPISLSGVAITGSGKTYQLQDISNLTISAGSYFFQVKNSGNGITDSFGNPLTTPVSLSWLNNYIPLTSNFQIPTVAGKPIDSLQIVFSKPVTGFGLGNLRLTRNSSNISTTNLSLSETFTGSGIFNLSGLYAINQEEGTYRIYLTNTSSIHDASGYSISPQGIQDNWIVLAQAPAVIATKINSANGTFAIVNPETGQTTGTIQPFPEFTGAIHVQQGNLLPNGHASLVTAAGDGGGPHIVVYDMTNSSVQRSFFAYSTEFRGGVFIAVGDLTGDGIDDLVTGPNKGGGPHVKVFDGRTNQVIREFMAYDPSFRGGVSVSIADVNGDNRLDIITGSGSGGGPNIKVFDFNSGWEMLSFMAYSPNFTGGVFVAAADLDGDGFTEMITGTMSNGGSHVKIFSMRNLGAPREFFAYASGFNGGVRVGFTDRNNDGILDIVTGSGPGGGPHVKIFDGRTLQVIDSFFASNPNDTSGVYVN